jgi:hypothetical protein
MQDGFPTSQKPLPEVVQEVKLAKKRNDAIVLVEYYDCGDTHKPILDELEGYGRVTKVVKHNDDGGSEVVSACDKEGFDMTTMRICGVNRSACVSSTIGGIKRALGSRRIPSPLFEIAIEATWCSNPKDGEIKLRRLGRFINEKEHEKKMFSMLGLKIFYLKSLLNKFLRIGEPSCQKSN